MEITQEMIDRAAEDEQKLMVQSTAVIAAQNQHLNNRVVVLRALVNEQQKEIDRLQKPRSRKTPPKKS